MAISERADYMRVFRYLAVIMVVGVAGCGAGDENNVETRGRAEALGDQQEEVRRRMTADEVPDEARQPAFFGDGSLDSLTKLLDLSAADGGKRAPAPATLDELVTRSEVIVHGTIDEARVVASEIKLTPELVGARVDVEFSVRLSEGLKGAKSASEVRWRIPIWMGDRVLLDIETKKAAEELGRGPVGSDALLFGVPATESLVATGESASSGTELAMYVISGLVTDGERTVTAAPAAAGESPYLVEMSSALADLRRLLGQR